MYNQQLVDVPDNCKEIFHRMINKAPDHIDYKVHSRGSHTGRGTSWAGAYTTYEIYDARRRDWPTEEAERWRQEIEWEIVSHLKQEKEMRVR